MPKKRKSIQKGSTPGRLRNSYGFFGWKEFASNRRDILSEYNRAIDKTQSRPVHTEPGIAAEAAFRHWLSSYLPKRYGVTSGYIIPDIVVSDNYKLYHYDVIIFDDFDAPILWVEGNLDQSSQGHRRAIPARYVKAVLEVKSTFTGPNIRAAISKLGELNDLAPYLPPHFTSHSVFFDLPIWTVPRVGLLRHLADQEAPGYAGGLILRCELNPEMTGRIKMLSLPEKEGERNDLLIPLAKDVDAVGLYLNNNGNPIISEQGAGLGVFAFPPNSKLSEPGWQGGYHFTKLYGPHVFGSRHGVALQWSYNGFAEFTLDLLSYLEGRSPYDPKEPKYWFGHVFDRLQPQPDSDRPSASSQIAPSQRDQESGDKV